MILPLAVVVCATLQFDQKGLDGLVLTPLHNGFGSVATNFYQEDMNGDGLPDLVYDNRVLFQHDGYFLLEQMAPFPELTQSALLDVWHGQLYFLFPGRLWIIQWRDGAWKTITDQPIDWPVPSEIAVSVSSAKGRVSLQRFILASAAGDAQIVLVDRLGVHVYTTDKRLWKEAAILKVLPPMQPALEQPFQQLWPEAKRNIVIPARQLSCRVVVSTSALSVITHEDAGDRQTVYRLTPYSLAQGKALPEPAVVTSPIPEYLQPWQEKDRLIFAGTQRKQQETMDAAPFVLETTISLDNGEHLVRRRVPSLLRAPNTSFADLDGDGKIDVVTEATTAFEGGLREMLVRFTTSNEVGEVLRVYFQRNNAFSLQPNITSHLKFDLGSPLIKRNYSFEQYARGNLLRLTGDYNGDGRKDLLVRDKPGRLQVYLCEDSAFSQKADASIPVPEDADFEVFDLNGDGRSDIVITLPGADGGPVSVRNIIYYAKGNS